MKKLFVFFLFVLTIVVTQSFSKTPINAQDDDWVFDLSQFRDDGYHRVLRQWLRDSHYYKGESIILDYDLFKPENNHLVYHDNYLELNKEDEAVISVNIPFSGLYHVLLDYKIEESFSTPPTILFSIDDKVPFNELNELPLTISYTLKEREEDEKYNRYGNELLPFTNAFLGDYSEYLVDPSGRYVEPLFFYFKKGVSTVKIKANNHPILLKTLTLSPKEEVLAYENYEVKHSSEQIVSDSIFIEGESFLKKNDIEVKSGYYKGSGMRPEAYKTSVLNMLDGNSMTRTGTNVTYYFDIRQTGLYHINLKYLQNISSGSSSARKILIDGKVPFKELEEYLFEHTKEWKNHALGGNKTPFKFYLEAGTHSITFESTMSHLTDIIDELYLVMDKVNGLGFAITQLTGQSSDSLIDWNIISYLPTVKEELVAMSDRLQELYEQIRAFAPKSKRVIAATTLLIASKQLKRLSKYPNRLPNKLQELNIGSGSAYQLIGQAISQISRQPLAIDYIYVYGDAKVPKANSNFFQKIWFNIKSFFYSFFDQRYKMTKKDKESVNVWVGKSTLYLDIMQNMIDSEFTVQTGIPVRLSVLPSTQKIILNHATRTNPDLIMSIDSWNPYSYALRGMLKDLTEFPGFYDLIEPYHPNNFTPMIFEDGVYGLPETQGIYLLFYRKDILNFLGINPPDTWDEVLNILPVLQSYQMNFYHPLGGEGAYKGFGLTSPFIYQFGGEIYQDISYQTTFNEENTINAITFMTDIFNKYNLPQQIPSFFEHFRSGSLPIGVATIDFYLQLKYAAPELNGQWDILPIPGIYDDTLGEVARWAPTYGKASIIMQDSKKHDESFELLKWWSSEEVQLKYLENIKMILGERYLAVPANLGALERSVWDQKVKDQSLLQARWSRIPAVTPGSYIIERELTNIWNKIVIDKVNPRIAIDQSIPRVNRELARKFEEFGYLKGGVVVREYIIPRNENIEKWTKRKD